MESNPPPERHTLRFDGREIEAEVVLHRGWAGIVYRSLSNGRLYLCDLEWRGGGYLERVRPMTPTEFETFRRATETEADS